MTDAERELLVHVAEWLIAYADPRGSGIKRARILLDRVILENRPDQNKGTPT